MTNYMRSTGFLFFYFMSMFACASPQYGGVQTSTSGVNRSSFSVGYDQLGLAIGDVLVVAVTTDYSRAGSIIVQGSGHPGGINVYNADSTAAGQPRLRVDVLVYDGTWPSKLNYRFGVSDKETWIAYATKWTGVDPGNPVAAAAGSYDGATMNPTSPALTAPEAGPVAVAIYGAREDDFDSNGTPAGYTEIAIGASNIGGMGSSSGIAYQAGISSGAVPEAMWTQAAAVQAHAVHLLLQGGDGNPTAAAPTFTPAGATGTDSVTVTLSSSTPVASIYYTTDGRTPTDSSTFYGGPFTLTGSATVKAIAVADGFNSSAVVSETYTITEIGSAPDIGYTPPMGTIGNTLLASALTASGPIVIEGDRDVHISGLRISNPKGSCIEIRKGASNIVIENSQIGPCAKYGINIEYSGHVTIKNNDILDINKDAVRSVKSHNIAVDSNRIEDAKRGYAIWNTTQAGNLSFTNNFVKNVSRISGGGGNVVSVANARAGGIRVNDNIAINEAGKSNAEDLVNVYNSSGLPNDPIQIKRNKFKGGGPSLSSGGIILGDQNGSYQLAEDNILVNPGQYGLQIGGGHHNVLRNNKVYSDDRRSFTNVGVIIWRYSPRKGKGTLPGKCYGHTVASNEITWWRGPNYKNKGNAPWLAPVYNPAFGDDKKKPNCGSIAGWSTNKFDTKDKQPANLTESIWRQEWNNP